MIDQPISGRTENRAVPVQTSQQVPAQAGPPGGVGGAVVLPSPESGMESSTPTAARRPRVSVVERLQPFLRNKKAAFGALVLLIFAFMAIFAPLISPGDPKEIVARRHEAPSAAHPFGTTGTGEDVFDQTVWGARRTLMVGFLVGIFTTAISAAVGMSAGYFGGRVDDVLSLITNIFLIVPSLPLLVVLAAFIGSGNVAYIIAVLSFTGWSWGARVLRSQTLSLREKDFISAAEVSGESRFRIIFGEIFPNMTSLVAAGMFGSVIYAIGAISALEFLGLGNTNAVSWGTNLYWAGNNGALLVGAWWTVLPAGVAIALVAFSLAMINYAVDEVTNPRLRAQRLATAALKKAGRGFKRSGRATPVIRHAN